MKDKFSCWIKNFKDFKVFVFLKTDGFPYFITITVTQSGVRNKIHRNYTRKDTEERKRICERTVLYNSYTGPLLHTLKMCVSEFGTIQLQSKVFYCLIIKI